MFQEMLFSRSRLGDKRKERQSGRHVLKGVGGRKSRLSKTQGEAQKTQVFYPGLEA